MKHTCPQCGHEFEVADASRSKAGKARWKGTTKKARSQAASTAAKARWDKIKKTKL